LLFFGGGPFEQFSESAEDLAELAGVGLGWCGRAEGFFRVGEFGVEGVELAFEAGDFCGEVAWGIGAGLSDEGRDVVQLVVCFVSFFGDGMAFEFEVGCGRSAVVLEACADFVEPAGLVVGDAGDHLDDFGFELVGVEVVEWALGLFLAALGRREAAAVVRELYVAAFVVGVAWREGRAARRAVEQALQWEDAVGAFGAGFLFGAPVTDGGDGVEEFLADDGVGVRRLERSRPPAR
jgi:hypothetical protein